MKKIIITVLVILAFFIFNACEEEINQPCGDDINITVIAKYGCDDACDNIADNTRFYFTNSTSRELLDSGTVLSGIFTYTPEESGCGVSNLSIRAEFQRYKPEIIQLDYICKDTTIEICFNTCEPDTNTNIVDCNSLDNISDLIFIDDITGESCIKRNSPSPNSYYFRNASLFNDSDCDIRISNFTNITNYNQNFENGKFRLKKPFTHSNMINGNDLILPAGERIDLFFEVLTDEVGQFADQLQYNLTCQGGSCSGNGVWTINLEAEVCETECDCPFGNSIDNNPVYEAPPLEVGEEHSASVAVATINSNYLKDGCYLQIVEIVRVNSERDEYALPLSNNPYTRVNDIDDWIITNQLNPEEQFSGKDNINLNFNLFVSKSGFLRDTFRLKTNVFSSEGELLDSECNYDFYLEGRGCEDGCALIDLDYNYTNNTTWVVNEVNVGNLQNKWDTFSWQNARTITSQETIQLQGFRNNNEIFYQFGSSYSIDNACGTNQNEYKFDFRLHLDEAIEYCDPNQSYTITIENPYFNSSDPNYNEDRNFFEFQPITSLNINDINGDDFTVTFTAPTYNEMRNIRNSLPGKNEFRYRLSIRSNDDNNCHIVLNFRTEISDLPIPGPIRQLYAYSQIEPNQLNPDYMAVQIDDWHPDGYWGVDKNQVPPKSGNYPISDDSFFINVTNPNGPFGQEPLLNLVPRGTVFRNIARVDLPSGATRYTSNDAFMNGYVDMINQVIFDANDCFALSPDRIASSFNGTNGITIESGEVYAVWSDVDYTSGSCSNPCNLALIYIYEVSNGDVADDQSDIANIRYRIVYPINK